jgi:hypothetical protein
VRLGSLRGYGEPLLAGDVLRPEARLTPGGRSHEAIAQELYGLPMSEFTAARDREAAAARQAGDRALAGELKKLRRPTAGAWLTNQLVRQRGDDVTALLHLGAALRDAQARLATDDLRRLSQQGQQLVTALGREARQLGRDAGQRVGEGAVREVEDTLHAALADPAASDAVRAGRLTSALSYAGFGSVDGSGVAPVQADAGAPPRAGGAPPGRAGLADAAAGQGTAQAQARQGAAQAEARQAAAQAAARQAGADLEEARQNAGDRQRRLEEARQEQARLDQQVEVASAELERLRGQARDAATAARDAERAHRDAERRLARAQATVDAGPRNL